MARKSIAKKIDKKLSVMNKYQLLALFIGIIVVFLCFRYNYSTLALYCIGGTFLLVVLFKIPVIKGKLGEIEAGRKLKKIAKKYKGFLINNFMFKTANGSSQIDHIVLIPSGIYVVETKAFSGYIFGDDNDENWTQTLAYGKVKHKKYNPVKQNNTHIYNLSKFLVLDKGFHNVVLLLDCNIKNVKSKYVYSKRNLKNAFYSNEILFTYGELEGFYNQILLEKSYKKVSKREHLQNIQNLKDNINNNICPRCGAKLVLRTSKNGYQFYGCSNYPSCTFTKTK